MKIKEDKGQLLKWAVVMLFTFHFSLLTSYAQEDDKQTMFNPVEHAVVSQTLSMLWCRRPSPQMPVVLVWATWVWPPIPM